MADPGLNEWAASLLDRLGIKRTPGAMQALVGWARAEGGHWHNDAKYNPLNTTQPEPGAGNTGSQGNIKVYKNWDQGLKATVTTLRNGRYDGILAALRSGNPGAVAQAIGRTPWGTSGSLVAQTIGATHGVHTNVQALPGGGGSSAGAAAGAATRTAAPAATTTTPGVDNSALRGQLIAQFLGRQNQDPLSFATSFRAASDVPAVTTTSAGTPLAPRATPSASSATAGFTTPPTASGVASFEGKQVAAWIAPALAYARKRGWKGTVSSGYRSFADQTRIYNSGVRPAARPGTSNHEGTQFPRGAVDVTDAATLSRILQGSPYGQRLKWAGAKDPVHFSYPHNGSY